MVPLQANVRNHVGRPDRRIKNKRPYVAWVPCRKGYGISPTPGRAEVVDFIVAKCLPDVVHVIGDVAGPVAAGGVAKLRGATRFCCRQGGGSVLQVRTIDSSGLTSPPVVDQEQIVRSQILSK